VKVKRDSRPDLHVLYSRPERADFQHQPERVAVVKAHEEAFGGVEREAVELVKCPARFDIAPLPLRNLISVGAF
jgi:hypothetical protein